MLNELVIWLTGGSSERAFVRENQFGHGIQVPVISGDSGYPEGKLRKSFP